MQIPWYKTRGGIIFLSIIGAVIGLVIIFFILTGYYLWSIAHGGAAELSKQFQSVKFTTDTTRRAFDTTTEDVTNYIRPHNPILGEKNAPITIVAFIDFECPYSQAGYQTLARIMETYTPVVRLVFKHFPISAIHPQSVEAAEASACADDQNKFWGYYDRLFQTKSLDRESLLGHARVTNLSVETFTSCLRNMSHGDEIDQDIRDGVALGVRGTPTYFINDVRIEGVVDDEVWDKIIIERLSP